MWGTWEMVALVVPSVAIVSTKSMHVILVCALIFWMVGLCWAHTGGYKKFVWVVVVVVVGQCM